MRFWKCAAALWLFMGGAAAQTIRSDHGDFAVSGWKFSAEPAEGWGSVFRIYAGAEASQTVLGSYALTGGELVFHPRLPRPATIAYRAVFVPAGVTQIFDATAAPAAAAKIEQIYPSIDVLPGNVLKLYLQFSAAMSRGEAWQRIHLLDEVGKAVPPAFLEIEQELWDAGNRRLTVLFDPGRIKRGLVPSDDMGTPIVEGRRYTLVIDKEWRDARGVPMVEGFQKVFRGGPVDRETPDPARWRITSPKAETMEPVVVDFVKPMDFGLVQRLIAIEGVEGTAAIGEREMQWRFTPKVAWKAGAYRLTADNALEDIAGNRLHREFDVDTSKATGQKTDLPQSSLTFEVR